METGWTHEEIKNMPWELKLIYVYFIAAERKKEEELMKEYESKINAARGVPGEGTEINLKFIDENKFYSRLGGDE